MSTLKDGILSAAVTLTDATGNIGLPGLSTATKNTVAPGDVTDLTATVGTNKITLDWTKPGDADFAGVNVYRDGTKLNTILVADPTNTYEDGTAVVGMTYTYTVKAVDTAGNESTGINVSATMTSPIVDTPVVIGPPAVTTAAAEVPADNQVYGADSYQGEVKADTEIKTDEGNTEDQNGDEDQPEDTKGERNVPLWGIIFLLILAGIGGYLFYSQGPDKSGGK